MSDFKLHINGKNLEQVDEFCNSGRMFLKMKKGWRNVGCKDDVWIER